MKYVLLAALTILSLNSCKEADEKDDLAKAQACLNKVTAPAQAEACMAHVAKYSSQQAMILKCSIAMTSGGFLEAKMVAAYNALKDDTITNKEAAFMTAMHLDYPDVPGGYTISKTADQYCQATGIKAHQYISGIIVAGSLFAKTMQELAIDPANPGPAVDQLLNDCAGATPSAECLAAAAELGPTVITLAQNYCPTAPDDDKVCKDLDGAIAAAGGVPANVGMALFCMMEEPAKTYDSGSNRCI